MSTSIITTTTFTIATVIDVQVPIVSATPLAPVKVEAAAEADLDEIPLCTIVAHPRCAWTARKRCSHRDSHKS